jgi:hypothetical protein
MYVAHKAAELVQFANQATIFLHMQYNFVEGGKFGFNKTKIGYNQMK